MSDREDEIGPKEDVIEVSTSLDVGSEPDIGACGGDHLRSFSPLSDSVDNLSLEVQFEDESSRHPSEISTLSYQNLLDDCDGSGNVLSRQESEDSMDSFPPDYADCFQQDSLAKCDLKDLPSAISEKYEKNLTERDLRRLNTENMIQSEDHFKDISLSDVSDVDSKNIPLTDNIPGVEYRQSRHSSEEKDSVKKRNSLEIRNNIPVIDEIKNYDKDREKISYNAQGAKPKIRKQSPGLACRVGDGSTGSGSDREGSSSEREFDKNAMNKNFSHSKVDYEGSSSDKETEKTVNCDKIKTDNPKMDDSENGGENGDIQPVKITNKRPPNLIQPHLRQPQDVQSDKTQNMDALDAKIKSLVDLGSKSEQVNGHSNLMMVEHGQGNDVENEYDYVKYARVQDGNSYVGMRLAYSSTEDSKRNSLALSGFSNNSTDVSRENSPEKTVAHPQKIDLTNSHALQNVNEDMLTEIPLDTTDSPHLEDKQTFSLSPENTECDSVEVESVTSDGDRSNMGMPLVEDGLSSSQASDTEDGPQSNVHKSPTARLREKQKAEIAQELENAEKQYDTESKPKEMDAEAIMEDLKAKREALDIAIADIKTAIQSSKGVSLQSTYKDENEGEEPIWVKRESFTETTKRKEELEKVRDELNRLQEEELRKKEEKVFEMENEKDKLLENQYSRNEGKPYQTPKGYDSDDEEEGVKYTRRMKGKKYASLPEDDSYDYGPSQAPALNGSNHNRMHSDCSSDSNEYNYTKRNRLHSESDSEEFGSDVEAPSKTTYMKQKTGDFDTDEETDILLQKQYQKDSHVDIPELTQPPINRSAQQEKRRSRAKEGEKESLSIYDPENPTVLIEGVLFRAKYLGSTQLISEGQPSKAMRMMQAQEAVGRIKTLGTLHFGTKFQAAAKQGNPPAETSETSEKAPEGENQPSTPVDLFVSTEKIMVLNTDLQEIMMDHSLRTISYIADIGDILVIMARRRILSSPGEDSLRRKKQAKILCHVFESEEAQLIAQSIGQAFQVAYMEFLKANGIEDPTLMKEIDYQDVLNQQEIYGEELNLFANKDLHKEVIVPKLKSEHLGVVIVESGWGSMVPTVVLANLCPNGPAARCGQLNIGDQIISINGISLVGLPLSACQTYIKNAKSQTVVKLTIVPCPPVVEVLIKRPDVKYQLGFSVQNGVICSLLRGGIAERGGVRVGHRIIEINNQSVVAVPHEKIVSLLANSVGEIHMKTMPTSIFRLLTGQETPHYL